MSLVGIIANPASGKDIRRLVAYGSVFDNQEKVRIVRRVILGLMAAGVDRICYMPDYFGIVPRAVEPLKTNRPVFPVNFKATATQEDSIQAGRIMAERGVGCIVTLGGDGTNRAVAKGCDGAPILPVSTGTNNVFPEMVEGTLAGLAAGLVAKGLVPLEEASYTSTKLEVLLDGRAADLALVDVVVYDDPFLGSRAVWDMDKVRQVFLNRAEPDCIGLSSIGGLIAPFRAEDPHGLALDLGPGGRPVVAPVAPGLIRTVLIRTIERLEFDSEVEIAAKPSILALDGEREIEIGPDQRAAVRVSRAGPVVVDVTRTMFGAARRGVLRTEAIPVT
ncbi:MAG: NAD(+)/NADH kinase [Thermodesulfobacteriota bacterium]